MSITFLYLSCMTNDKNLIGFIDIVFLPQNTRRGHLSEVEDVKLILISQVCLNPFLYDPVNAN